MRWVLPILIFVTVLVGGSYLFFVNFPIANQKKVVIVADFSKYPLAKNSFSPLVDRWFLEKIEPIFVDIATITNEEGKDRAEILYNYLANLKRAKNFQYLFLVDIQDGLASVPARVFTEKNSADINGQNVKIWSDFYFSDLLGKFDANGDNTYTVNDATDYIAGPEEELVVVGRLVLDSQSYQSQLFRYINSDLMFREKATISELLTIKTWTTSFRDGGSFPWPGGNDNEDSQTLGDFARGQGYHQDSIVSPTKIQALEKLAKAELVYFVGHGSSSSQQINNTNPNTTDGVGEYLYYHDLSSAAIKNPIVAFFQGCETGKTYLEDGTVSTTIAQGLLLNNNSDSVTGVIGLANTVVAANYTSDFADLIQGASYYQSIGKYLTIVNKRLWSQNQFDRTDFRIALSYFGDPTIPYPKLIGKDSTVPKIIISNTDSRLFTVVDSESGIKSITVKYDDSLEEDINSIFLSSPHYISKRNYKKIKIFATDRSNNTTSVNLQLND